MSHDLNYYINFIAAKLTTVNPEVALVAVVLLSMLIVLDRITSSLTNKKIETGLNTNNSMVSVDGSKSLPVRQYVSDIQGIAGRPDAVINEHGYLIPVERKPLARKLRDRYVAQLLTYMRLIEEFEGKKPPYGYLILGPSCRRIKIDNTDERQAWLQSIIDEMRGILDGKAAKPSPMAKKCRKCEMRESCAFRADLEPVNQSELIPAPTRARELR